ncbi:alpha/beta hydrolase fold domain-containing protein [Thermodesulfobacteriota bacterium]
MKKILTVVWVFLICLGSANAQEAPIWITSPSGGEIFYGGTEQVITWDDTAGADSQVTIEYSKPGCGGTVWTILETDNKAQAQSINIADKQFAWKVPCNIDLSSSSIRITMDSAAAVTSQPFGIEPNCYPEDPEIEFTFNGLKVQAVELGMKVNYKMSAADPDGDTVRIAMQLYSPYGIKLFSLFLADNGTFDVTPSAFSVLGEYEIKLKAVDEHDAETQWADVPPLTVRKVVRDIVYWTADNATDGIYRMNTSDNLTTAVKTPNLNGLDFNIRGITMDGNNMWIVDAGKHSDNGSILKIDPYSGEILSVFIPPGPTPWGIAFDGEYLWHSDKNGQIYKLTTSGIIKNEFTATYPNPRGLAIEGSSLWITSESNNIIYKLDPGNHSITELKLPILFQPQGLAFDNNSLWVTSKIYNTIYWIDPLGSDNRTYDADLKYPVGIAARDGNVWAASESSLELDLYLQQTPGPVPVVMYIHGGSFALGGKECPPLLDDLLSNNFAVASINYRLSWRESLPAAFYDTRAALCWLKKSAAAEGNDLNIDPDRIAVWGYSAGGAFSNMLGLNDDNSMFDPGEVCDNVGCQVQAAITWAGPTDFVSAATTNFWTVGFSAGTSVDLMEGAFGCPYEGADSCPDRYFEASPINNIQIDKASPLLLFQHWSDRFVAYCQSESFFNKFAADGEFANLEDSNEEPEIFKTNDNNTILYVPDNESVPFYYKRDKEGNYVLDSEGEPIKIFFFHGVYGEDPKVLETMLEFLQEHLQ